MSAESTAQQAALTQAAAQLQALAPADLLALFGPGISQQARLITLETAQGSGLPDSLVADRFWGSEGVNLFSSVSPSSTATNVDCMRVAT